jgi:flavin-dependent dehydrogenase
MDIAVVGGGPAGLSFAWLMKGRRNYDVTVYEGLDKVGYKPCAWGLMNGVEDLIPLKKEHIVSEIKGFRIFLDGKIVHDIRGDERLGYIVDKPMMLRDMASQLNVKYKSNVSAKDGKPFVSSQELKADKVIFANGHYSLPKDRTVPAIQYVTDFRQDPEVVDFYFYSDLLGYAWVFPDREGAKIGIGGYADVNFLQERLKPLVKGRISLFHGARVSDTGVVEDRLNGNYMGEALGTVYALTGEGIRPSIISAKIMAESILENKDFKKEFKKSKLYNSLKVHAKIVSDSKGKDKLEGLTKVLMKSDPKLVLKVALGDFNNFDLLKLLGRTIF